MAIKNILKMGEPQLIEQSLPIERDFPDDELQLLIKDLLDTMNASNGAGLAAPQIGVLKRLVVFGMEENSENAESVNPRYPDSDFVPLTILINPEIEPLDDNFIESWEGCLSIPGMRGLVSRHSKIRYKGYDQNWNIIDREVEGFHAIVVQHECDHLEGILYPMRISDMRYFGFEEALSKPVAEVLE
ncbi:MAG: peptide deformylase [Gammaproteobacteria bacterium]|nr:peptide deformylase [Gammaproteobacteria bacterium]